MKKNIYLTPAEQKVFGAISSENIIDTRSLQEIFPEIPAPGLNKIVAGLAKKGYLHRVKKGTYVVSGKASQSPQVHDPVSLALAVCPGYVGFSSALRVYDLISYEPFTVFVVTKSRSKETEIGEYTIKCVAMGRRCVGMTLYKDVYVSTLEKTFFDCFYKPHHAGGYSVITEALFHAPPFDWQKFCRYFEPESSSLCQRTGYILEELNRRTGTVPEEVIAFFQSRIKNNTLLVSSGAGTGRYVPSWKLIDNIGQESIFSWWSHD